ncbi:MAG TPA: hypothetical protein DCQ31_00420 [Bacteroidales bacterium]|nr:hypothetical protein [Bacteroidales bacterium]
MSKGQAVSLAVSLLAVDFWFNRKLLSVKVIAEKIPYFALALVFGIVAIKAQASGDALRDFAAYSFHERIIFASYSLFGYIWKLVLPLNLSALYPYPFRSNLIPGYFWAYLLATAAFIYGLYIAFKNDKRIFFGLAFFAINIGLLLQLIPVGSAVMSDRYALIPSFGFAIALVFLGEKLIKKFKLEPFALYLVVGYAVLLGILTAIRTEVWQNSLVLWTDVIEKQPKAVIGLNNRGALYNQMEKYELAVVDFTKAVRLKPDYSEAFYNMGSAKKELGLIDDAIRDYKMAIKYDEKIYQAHLGLAVVYDEQLKFDQALAELEIALKILPDYTEALTNKGVLLGKTGKYENAIESFNKVLHFDPNNTSALVNRGFAKYFLKQYNEAIADFTQVIALDPTVTNAFINRGLVYSALNRTEEAVSDYKAALVLDPANSDAYYNIGFVLRSIDKNESCLAFKRSMELGNKTAEVYYKNNCL